MAPIPYTRRHWESPYRVRVSRTAEDEGIFISDKFVFLRDAVSFWGEQNIPDWNGAEKIARVGLGPPKKPEASKIYDSEGRQKSVSSEEAEAWWEKIEPDLNREREEEQAAAERWRYAVDRFRNILAAGDITAQIMTPEDGHLHEIRLEIWRSDKAEDFFKTGFGEIWSYNNYIIEGPIIIERADLQKLIEGKANVEDPELERLGVDFDPERFPYLTFMIQLANELSNEPDKKPGKKAIEYKIENAWPKQLGESAMRKVDLMATFLRRPKDEKGGNQ